MDVVPVPTDLDGRYLAWYWYGHIQILSIMLSFSFLNTTALDMLYVPLYYVLYNYSGIDRDIKRVENRLGTTDSSASELDSQAGESIVIR
jgi:hypothetical protein